MNFHVIIPARYGSTRLPGKPLLDIGGKPMIQRVYEQACNTQAASVTIATDDQRIFDSAQSFGAKVVMTAEDHESGTDRLQETVVKLGLADEDIVVNVQGDEPLLPPELVQQVAHNLATTDSAIATLCEPLTDIALAFDPNVVKVVMDAAGFAMYFSRASIPFHRASYTSGQPELNPALPVYRHIGLYAYRVGLLHDFVRWGPCPLEQAEALEQLRAMWHGAKIHVAVAQITPPAGVDSADDLARVRAIIEANQ